MFLMLYYICFLTFLIIFTSFQNSEVFYIIFAYFSILKFSIFYFSFFTILQLYCSFLVVIVFIRILYYIFIWPFLCMHECIRTVLDSFQISSFHHSISFHLPFSNSLTSPESLVQPITASLKYIHYSSTPSICLSHISSPFLRFILVKTFGISFHSSILLYIILYLIWLPPSKD